jgi:hypothetical protein
MTPNLMANPHLMNEMYKILDTFSIDLLDVFIEQDLKSLVAI